MKAQDLKNSILQLAIQGKLVPQDPNDEPASVLLEKIKEEKAELVKQGKIKKDKQESYIFRGDDNKYYEKVGSETKNITEEIPFEIPNSWEWVKIKFLCDTYTGNSISENIKKSKYTNLDIGYNYIGTKDVGFDNTINYNNGVKIPYNEEKFLYAYPEDILLCIEGGSAGRKIAILSQTVCFGNKLCNFHQYTNSTRYLYYLLQSPYFFGIFKDNIAGIIGGVSINKIKELIIPLPPLSEQKRIVSKIEELEPFIDEYGTTETELTELNTNFPDQIKKSILQYAIQGKLVKQDPNDEPASVLLEKIKAEKAELVKQGKIKKDKQESFIYKGPDNRYYEKIGSEIKDITDEIPFDIPNNWEWLRLKELSIIQEGAGILTKQYRSEGIQILTVTNILEGGIDLSKSRKYIEKEEYEKKYSHLTPKRGDIVSACSGGSWGKTAIFDKDDVMLLNTSTLRLRCFNDCSDNLYLYYITKSSFFKKQLKEQLVGLQPNFGYTHYSKILIPLPPLSEQERIVKRITNFLEIIADL